MPLSDLSLSVSFSSENGPKSRHYPVHRCRQSEERWVKGAIFTFSSSFFTISHFFIATNRVLVRDPSLELATPLSLSLYRRLHLNFIQPSVFTPHRERERRHPRFSHPRKA